MSGTTYYNRQKEKVNTYVLTKMAGEDFHLTGPLRWQRRRIFAVRWPSLLIAGAPDASCASTGRFGSVERRYACPLRDQAPVVYISPPPYSYIIHYLQQDKINI